MSKDTIFFRPQEELLHVGPPCHGERLDPTRRYGLTATPGELSVHDWQQPGAPSKRLVWSEGGREVLAMFGYGELFAVPDDYRLHVLDSQAQVVRSFALPRGFGTINEAHAAFAADGRSVWVYSESASSICALQLDTSVIHQAIDVSGQQLCAALWVHPQYSLVVLDTYTPQNVFGLAVVEQGGHGLVRLGAVYCHHELGEFIGFDRGGEYGTYVDGYEITRWSLRTGRHGESLQAAALFGGQDAMFGTRASSLGGRVSALWTGVEATRICVLTNELTLSYAIDFTDAEGAPLGSELLASDVLRIPFAAETAYYRLHAQG